MIKKLPEKKKKILVGLSGGVDSFMTAHHLRKAGWQVSGVFLEMQKNSQKLKEARLSAKKLGIELEVVDCQKEFQKEIVDSFVESYQKGQTPNPCVFCNPQIKFKLLLELAQKRKIPFVATGHYAQIEKIEVGNKKSFFLKKGTDETKDQSYFLYRLKQPQLKKILFPLGEKSKAKLQAEARELGFYDKKEIKESQDICFFAKEQTLANFLQEKIVSKKGKIIDQAGNILGNHQGLEKYTLGQRKGIEISGGPFFVIEKNFKNNTLTVSKDKKHPLLWKKEIFLKKVFWTGEVSKEKKDYLIKIRYGNKGVLGRIKQNKKTKKWQIVLREAQWAPAIGQSAVIFDGDWVVGGGVISA